MSAKVHLTRKHGLKTKVRITGGITGEGTGEVCKTGTKPENWNRKKQERRNVLLRDEMETRRKKEE